jgi:APA family basic amino acid/polyamine antiporter
MLFVVFCLVLIALTLYNRPGEAIIGLLLISTGIPFYLKWKNRPAMPEADEESLTENAS